MKNPCEWCVNTSNEIDSIEYQIELAENKIKLLKEIINNLREENNEFKKGEGS